MRASIVLVVALMGCPDGDNRTLPLPEPASCIDGTANGDETDIDCGGSCGPCAPGAHCITVDDCASVADPCISRICNPFGRCDLIDRARCGDPAAPGGGASCASECVAPDSDGDGFQDLWEIGQPYYGPGGILAFNPPGIDLNCDSLVDPTVDLVLPDARPDVPNVYLEIDYLERALPAIPTTCDADGDCSTGEQCMCRLEPDSCSGGATCDPVTRRCTGGATGHFCTHSHKPKLSSLVVVERAFQPPGLASPANVPVHGPMILTIDRTFDRIEERDVVTFDEVCSGPSSYRFADLKTEHFDPRRRWVYHYAISAHDSTCAGDETGLAELAGNDLIVSLGDLYFEQGVARTDENEGGAILHQLGHNFDLRHGGFEDAPLKPNYVSVMNPLFAAGIRTANAAGATSCAQGCPVRIDFSSSLLPPLDESDLDERAGITAGNNDISRFSCTPVDFPGTPVVPSSCPNFDGDGAVCEPSVSADLDCSGSATDVLVGHRDWPGQACTTSADCPVCSGACPQTPGPIPGDQLPPSCPLGTEAPDCHVPCIRGTCMPLELAFQCRPGGSDDGPRSHVVSHGHGSRPGRR